ncbi:hypothetical protein SY88_19975 [Clostridiales bacterium PH28_bin88]|nr:hypothetical protein SY88_19975 [Clostridiales bacterium PH28_bin88]
MRHILWELDGTVDLALYTVETGGIGVIAEGTHEFYYYPIKWDSDGTLVYGKNWFNEKAERLKYLYK